MKTDIGPKEGVDDRNLFTRPLIWIGGSGVPELEKYKRTDQRSINPEKSGDDPPCMP
jgi:hypothetical protein